ncbi:hypothetical protein GGF32_009011 [Allomyces javanicus]|nr:hypothetical protein GGF32_009011 [Allomyces javanicus]
MSNNHPPSLWSWPPAPAAALPPPVPAVVPVTISIPGAAPYPPMPAIGTLAHAAPAPAPAPAMAMTTTAAPNSALTDSTNATVLIAVRVHPSDPAVHVCEPVVLTPSGAPIPLQALLEDSTQPLPPSAIMLLHLLSAVPLQLADAVRAMGAEHVVDPAAGKWFEPYLRLEHRPRSSSPDRYWSRSARSPDVYCPRSRSRSRSARSPDLSRLRSRSRSPPRDLRDILRAARPTARSPSRSRSPMPAAPGPVAVQLPEPPAVIPAPIPVPALAQSSTAPADLRALLKPQRTSIKFIARVFPPHKMLPERWLEKMTPEDPADLPTDATVLQRLQVPRALYVLANLPVTRLLVDLRDFIESRGIVGRLDMVGAPFPNCAWRYGYFTLARECTVEPTVLDGAEFMGRRMVVRRIENPEQFFAVDNMRPLLDAIVPLCDNQW